ncbi:hypothetical protein AALT_g3850 [Alternaria alternata]|nr:hypothetical protein AALT_g3850 [Alternaria alternata]
MAQHLEVEFHHHIPQRKDHQKGFPGCDLILVVAEIHRSQTGRGRTHPADLTTESPESAQALIGVILNITNSQIFVQAALVRPTLQHGDKEDQTPSMRLVIEVKIRSLPVKPLQSHQIQPKITVPRQPQYRSDQTTAFGETKPKSKPKQSYRNQSARPKTVELQIPETNSPKRNISTLPPVPEIRPQPPTSARAPRRQPHPVVRESSHPPTNRPAPPVPEPSHWQHPLPQRPLTIRKETLEHEVSSQRESAGRGVDDKSEIGSAASYYDQAPRSPMPGSYEEGVETEYEEDDQPENYNEVPYPDTPPSPVIPPYSDTLPSAVGSEDPSVSSSPIMSHTLRAASPSPRSTSAFLQSIQMPTPQQSVPPTPPPPPPPPPPSPPPPHPASPLPAVRPPNNTGMAALFGEINGAGRVVYEETAYSHDVEERERAQAREANNQSPSRGNSAWSTRISMDDEDDIQPVPNRAFQNDLAKALQARRSGSGSRTSMIANVSGKLRDEIDAPVQRLSKSESDEDLIFILAAHIAQPGWSFDDLTKD